MDIREAWSLLSSLAVGQSITLVQSGRESLVTVQRPFRRKAAHVPQPAPEPMPWSLVADKLTGSMSERERRYHESDQWGR